MVNRDNKNQLLYLFFRWHVRNRDNKERVRKDEENAKLEEKKEEERIALAVRNITLSLYLEAVR